MLAMAFDCAYGPDGKIEIKDEAANRGGLRNCFARLDFLCQPKHRSGLVRLK